MQVDSDSPMIENHPVEDERSDKEKDGVTTVVELLDDNSVTPKRGNEEISQDTANTSGRQEGAASLVQRV